MAYMNRKATIKVINKIADLNPNKLIKYTIEDFAETGSKMNPEDIIAVFKKYKPLDNGNKKLAKGIFSFSLIPVVTCNQHCKGCYDVRSLRYRDVRMKRIVNTLLAVSHSDWLFERIEKQIMNARTIKAVRIHVGGDFFSWEYATQWGKLALDLRSKRPAISVYTYTKTEHTFILKGAGINVVKSRYEDHFNFGPKEQVIVWAKQYQGTVCPATMKKDVPDGFCGAKCTACMDREKVFFVLH